MKEKYGLDINSEQNTCKYYLLKCFKIINNEILRSMKTLDSKQITLIQKCQNSAFRVTFEVLHYKLFYVYT